MNKKSKAPAVLAGLAGLAAAVAVYDKVSGEKSLVKQFTKSLFYPGLGVEAEEVPYLNLRKGDHVLAPEKGFIHHGIWSGNDVIQLDVDPEDQGRVVVHRLPLDTFLALGEPEWLAHYQSRKVLLRAAADSSPLLFTGEEVIERAESKMGTEAESLSEQNSERFARWCRAGE